MTPCREKEKALHEWEVRTSGDHVDTGTAESLTDCWHAAIDTASWLLDRSASDTMTIEVDDDEVFVLPGDMWPREEDNIVATRAVLEALRADMIAASRPT